MRVLIQRVSSASITINNTPWSAIWTWYVCYVWISTTFTELNTDQRTVQITKAVERILSLPLFKWSDNKLSESLSTQQWDLLVVPNFTLRWRCKKWNNVDFTKSGSFKESKQIFAQFMETLYSRYSEWVVFQWEFWAYMQIEQCVDGPVNFIYE